MVDDRYSSADARLHPLADLSPCDAEKELPQTMVRDRTRRSMRLFPLDISGPNRQTGFMHTFRPKRFLCLFCLIVLSLFSTARIEAAVSWPQFRGPNSSGVS